MYIRARGSPIEAPTVRFRNNTEEILVEDIARIYIKEVFIRYKALDKIILDRDLRFIVAF